MLAQGDWWHIVPSAILTCLLPDINHPKSFLGQRLKWISKPIARAFGHRGFTPQSASSLRCWQPFILRFLKAGFIPADALRGMVLGYLSHILADMLTPAGVPLLWPCRWRSAYLSWFPKRATNWNVYLHGIISLVVWMPLVTENGALELVIAND
ncbi:metal-dependent hydrolase [Shigella flexneri]